MDFCEIYSSPIPHEAAQADISAGFVHGNRVAIVRFLANQQQFHTIDCVFATKNKLFHVALNINSEIDPKSLKFTKNPKIPFPTQINSKITEIPSFLENEIAEINILKKKNHIIATDSLGNTNSFKILQESDNSLKFEKSSSFIFQLTESSANTWSSPVELGYCGATFNEFTNQLAICSQFEKKIKIFDYERPEIGSQRTLLCKSNPTKIAFLNVTTCESQSSTCLLAVAEGYGCVTFWDVNTFQVVNILKTPSLTKPIYDIKLSPKSNLIVLGGADRDLVFFNPQKWNLEHKIQGCLKHEISSINFNDSKNCIYVCCFSDPEFTSLEFNETEILSFENKKNPKEKEITTKKSKFGNKIFANGDWIGQDIFIKNEIEDYVVGVSRNSMIYVIKNGFKLL